MRNLWTPLAIATCLAAGVWNIGWPSWWLHSVLGGINIFLAGALVGQWATYRHVDSILGRYL